MKISPTKSSKYPFKNLVFQGGGVKAFVYHGVLEVLEEHAILPQIERVAGASAGAIQATLLSFRLNAHDTIEISKSMDFSRITGWDPSLDSDQEKERSLTSQLGKIWGNLDIIERFVRRFGLYTSQYMHEWLQDIIANFCDGNGRGTFSDFRALGFRDLHIVVVNASRHRAEIFNADNTPQVAVADAVLMSGSIPFFFEAIKFDGHNIGQGDYYVDGGVLSNYPLTIFDQPKYEKESRHFTYGVNWETLGCRIFTPPECDQRTTPITNIINYAENVVETIAEMQNVAIEQRTVDQMRSISISNCCVSTIDFNIQPDLKDEKYIEMLQSGQQAAMEYLENYRLPTDWLAGLKEKMGDLFEMW